ncbi:MAG TPA: hypothetical protein VJ787_05625 [Thermoleophilia bacterium]|nr:hypothetical protein [Thermoleophilia bacterium]
MLDTVARTATETLSTYDCTIWEYDADAGTIVGRSYFGPAAVLRDAE